MIQAWKCILNQFGTEISDWAYNKCNSNEKDLGYQVEESEKRKRETR